MLRLGIEGKGPTETNKKKIDIVYPKWFAKLSNNKSD